jgi:hypothetical protein
LCVPPGRQSRARRSAGFGRFLFAHCACSGESHSLPRANHFISAFGFVRFNWLKVGSSSAWSRARKAVGRLSIRIVQ